MEGLSTVTAAVYVLNKCSSAKPTLQTCPLTDVTGGSAWNNSDFILFNSSLYFHQWRTEFKGIRKRHLSLLIDWFLHPCMRCKVDYWQAFPLKCCNIINIHSLVQNQHKYSTAKSRLDACVMCTGGKLKKTHTGNTVKPQETAYCKDERLMLMLGIKCPTKRKTLTA